MATFIGIILFLMFIAMVMQWPYFMSSLCLGGVIGFIVMIRAHPEVQDGEKLLGIFGEATIFATIVSYIVLRISFRNF